jgi:hypothetical protein
MKNNPFIKKEYNEFKVIAKNQYLQKDLKTNTVDINRLINRVKLKEKSKKKENLIISVVAIAFILSFAFITLL